MPHRDCLKLFVTIWNSILKQPMKFTQKISSHSDAQKCKQESVLKLQWQNINKHRPQYVIKASAFYKIQNFFCFFLSKHSFGTWAKCICEVLTLVTICEPTLIGQRPVCWTKAHA